LATPIRYAFVVGFCSFYLFDRIVAYQNSFMHGNLAKPNYLRGWQSQPQVSRIHGFTKSDFPSNFEKHGFPKS
jgi:hypothetical protein